MNDIKELKDGIICHVKLIQTKKGSRLELMQSHNEGGYYFPTKNRKWTILAGTLLGMSKSKKKALASKRNGKKGGKPANV